MSIYISLEANNIFRSHLNSTYTRSMKNRGQGKPNAFFSCVQEGMFNAYVDLVI